MCVCVCMCVCVKKRVSEKRRKNEKVFVRREWGGDYDGMMIESQCIQEEAKKSFQKDEKIIQLLKQNKSISKTRMPFSHLWGLSMNDVKNILRNCDLPFEILRHIKA